MVNHNHPILLFSILIITSLHYSFVEGTTEPAPLPSMVKPGCAEKCGNIIVPYPFGIDNPKCSFDQQFLMKCKHDVKVEDEDDRGAERNPRPWLMYRNYQVTNISLDDGKATVWFGAAYDCQNESNFIYVDGSIDLASSPFTFSKTANKFMGVGCRSAYTIYDREERQYLGSCVSYCQNAVSLIKNDSCFGVGCCEAPIREGLNSIYMYVLPVDVNDSSVGLDLSPPINIFHSSPCSYAFLMARDQQFPMPINISDMFNPFRRFPAVLKRFPAVLNWVIGNDKCGSNNHTCSGSHTTCINSTEGSGHRCICQDGYRGNPYLPDGCQDIDECKDRKKYPCGGHCKNTPGNYTCTCLFGILGDGKKGCTNFLYTTLGTASGCITVVAIIIVSWVEYNRHRKASNFRRNGGLVLKHQNIRIFSIAELKRATGNYSSNNLLGEGGSASVYKGVLEDHSLVAVKKPKVQGRSLNKQFPDEVIGEHFKHELEIVATVHQKNIVKLVGICLETRVASLVYEFVSNGTLYDHIHVKLSPMLQSWRNRLRIAAETSVALMYMHSLADPPIIHGDVKSTNILLDDKFTAKVSDFGTSVLLPMEQSAIVASKIQGTRGYLDPEYIITGNLTAKSDVYSFGVVLMELITGEKPVAGGRSGEKINYIQYFITLVEEKRISQILEVGEPGEMEQMETVAEISRRCLHRSGRQRPTMKEVADELLQMLKFYNDFPAQENEEGEEESESLLPMGMSMTGEDFTTCQIDWDTYHGTQQDIELERLAALSQH